ncbi:hypothetical protein QBC46DRAFT_416158 [Diplogelasinospora grovesii]|uniref:PLD phosphodiesterase domain-containing protein n=1 Tax=Diplogelasinospora grovesii TaxID=303347 RepID=A0AAN6N1G8_9PEZI|nr:hypothetical protein QBC46DRAFT_416158 [Diplogelasinospora grovesii]
MDHRSGFVREFLERLESQSRGTRQWQNTDLPNYNVCDARDQELVISHSTPLNFQLGTGASLFTSALIPAILSAKSEIILVTCFWAPSQILLSIRDALAEIATQRRCLIQGARSRGAHSIQPLRIRICFSSRSFLQRLFHPQSRDGYIYPPSTWCTELGLPGPSLLEAGGIDLVVKSLFFLPFSVMHPKFIIIDRQRALIPSCNVSWESWLEGCVEIAGDAVLGLMSFYARTWDRSLDVRQPVAHSDAEVLAVNSQHASPSLIRSSADYLARFSPTATPLLTLILPSSHHRNPDFRPLPWQRSPRVPGTPLNVALLQLFEQAQHTIYIQTPNLTCEPVVSALLDALRRGVDVTIVTNRKMMLLEQLITAGTTTSWRVRSLVRRFSKLRAAHSKRHPRSGGFRALPTDEGADMMDDLEAAPVQLGHLLVSYFRARPHGDRWQSSAEVQMEGEEPVHSHVKLTIVDEEYTVLGSGNMDRASWYTSQELGILLQDREFAAAVKAGVDRVLDGRLDRSFDSAREPT